jgi:hypothetical protein
VQTIGFEIAQPSYHTAEKEEEALVQLCLRRSEDSSQTLTSGTEVRLGMDSVLVFELGLEYLEQLRSLTKENKFYPNRTLCQFRLSSSSVDKLHT